MGTLSAFSGWYKMLVVCQCTHNFYRNGCVYVLITSYYFAICLNINRAWALTQIESMKKASKQTEGAMAGVAAAAVAVLHFISYRYRLAIVSAFRLDSCLYLYLIHFALSPSKEVIFTFISFFSHRLIPLRILRIRHHAYCHRTVSCCSNILHNWQGASTITTYVPNEWMNEM